MSQTHKLIMGGVFLCYFLLLTPLGIFGDWIPPLQNTGYYSVLSTDPGDDTGYYAYLRSGFFDGDWDFINEPNYAHSERFNATGYVFTNWQIGQSLLFLPFFLVGHLLALLLNSLGFSISLNGNSIPYYIATAVASQTYVLIGLVILYDFLRKFYSENASLLATLACWLGSCLLYYTFIRQRMAHGTEFCFSVIFVWVWHKWRTSSDLKHHAWIGVVLGFLCMIRIINAVFCVLYAVDMILQWWLKNNRLGFFKIVILRGVVFGTAVLLVLSPQFYTWNQIDGSLTANIAKALSGFHGQTKSSTSILDWFNRAYNLMLGPQWSLVFSSPILFVGFCGVLVSRKLLQDAWLPVLFFIAVYFIMVMSAVPPESFGNRYLIPMTAIFALGLGALFERSRPGSILFRWSFAICLVGIIFEYALIANYRTLLTYNDPEFSLRTFDGLKGLFTDDSRFLLRSTNFFRLLFLEKSEPWSIEDFLMLVIFPLFQSSMICAILFWEGRFRKFAKQVSLKLIFYGTVVAVLMALAVVRVMTPDKTEEEINNRLAYIKTVERASVFLKAGMRSEGLEVLEESARLTPGLAQPYYRMAELYSLINQLDKAENYYRKFLSVFYRESRAWYSLGNLLEKRGKLKEAEASLRNSIRWGSYDAATYDLLARVFAKQNKNSQADIFFQTALALNPNFGEVHLNYAFFLTKLGIKGSAINHLKRAVELKVRGSALERLKKRHGLKG